MMSPHATMRFAAGDEVRPPLAPEALPDGPNIRWVESWRARIATARGNAELRVGIDWVRMTIPSSPASPPGALRANAYLPSNLRYSGPRNKASLVADGWPTQESFQGSIQEFRVGVRSARPRTRTWTPSDSPESECHAALIEEMDTSGVGLDVVPRPPGWELGPRIRGRRVPVRVTPEPGGLRLHRLVLDASRFEPGSSVEASVCDAALRLNRRIRFARFALHERGLAVEARLSAELLDESRLVESAHAIAVVSQEFGPELDLLSRHAGVARCYARIFQPEAQEHAA